MQHKPERDAKILIGNSQEQRDESHYFLSPQNCALKRTTVLLFVLLAFKTHDHMVKAFPAWLQPNQLPLKPCLSEKSEKAEGSL